MSPIRMEKVESAMRVVLAFNEAFNQRDIPAMARLVREDCVFESFFPAPDGGVFTGKAQISQFWQHSFAASPHGQIKIEEIFGFDVRCIVRWHYEWEDAAGKQGHLRGVDVYKVKDGLLCEILSYAKG